MAGSSPDQTRSAEARSATPARSILSGPWPALAFAALLPLSLALPGMRGRDSLVGIFLGVAAGLGAWALTLWLLPARRARGFALDLVAPLKSHYVQAGVQICIYAYWGWYWRNVYAESPLILAQLAFLYAFDALLTWTRGRAWRLGFGPLPIILSTNLFIWFRDDWFLLQFAMIASCALGKEFLRWTRDGRSTHVFNPAAFGLGLFSLWLIASGRTTELTWGVEVATTLGFPPYIYALIFGLGLVVQYLFAVTLMTVSAVAALVVLNLAYTHATGVYQFVDTNIPIAIFLGLHLLMTDPSTSPRTNTGRVIFGTFYGVGSFVFYGVLRGLGAPEFYDKLLTVPVLNLGVQMIDRISRAGWLGRLERWQTGFRPRSANLVHMGGWSLLFLTLLSTDFVQAPHPGASLAFWRQALAEGKPRADENVLRLLQASVERGSLEARIELGREYREGTLVPHDEARATQLFAEACRGGHLRGCAELVSQFLAVDGAVPGDLVRRALTLVERGCQRGHGGRPCYLIGLAYEHGRGRPLDPARAAALYLHGCDLGNIDAAEALLRMSAREALPHIDPGPALSLLERSCASGNAKACEILAAARRRDE